MKKEEIAKQRQIGAILTKLSLSDRQVLENYMESLEGSKTYKKKAFKPQGVEQRSESITKSFSGTRPLGSRHFTEDQIHKQMLEMIDGEGYKDLKELEGPAYLILRKSAISKLHNKKS